MKIPKGKHQFAPGNTLARINRGRKKKPGEKKRGPKPNWYKEKCEDLILKGRLFNVLSDVASGAKVDRHITLDGRSIAISASIRNRLTAIAELRDTAFGKPGSSVDVTSGGKAIQDLPSIIAQARKRAQQ